MSNNEKYFFSTTSIPGTFEISEDYDMSELLSHELNRKVVAYRTMSFGVAFFISEDFQTGTIGDDDFIHELFNEYCSVYEDTIRKAYDTCCNFDEACEVTRYIVACFVDEIYRVAQNFSNEK